LVSNPSKISEPKKEETRMKESEIKESIDLTFLVKTQLSVEKLRVAVQVRNTHLAKRNRRDPDTCELEEQLQKLEKFIDGKVGGYIDLHPAQPWFSLIKGIGRENIAKVIGLIDIEKVTYVSSLWKWAGMHVVDGKSPQRKGGQKIEYNAQLRTMCWRLIRAFCLAQNKYYDWYIKEKSKYQRKFLEKGWKIIPASELPKDKNGKKYEPEGIISEGHLDNMAKRKMIKMFLEHLFRVWREALGLPATKPYVLEHGGHHRYYSPWDFVDKPPRKEKPNK